MEYISAVIITIITGIFSLITLIIQKKQDKVISNINEQTSFLEKEKDLKKKLDAAEKDKASVINEILLITLETNINIMRSTYHDGDQGFVDRCIEQSEALKKKYHDINDDIAKITKEYDLVIDMTAKFMKELEKAKSEKNDK